MREEENVQTDAFWAVLKTIVALSQRQLNVITSGKQNNIFTLSTNGVSSDQFAIIGV